MQDLSGCQPKQAEDRCDHCGGYLWFEYGERFCINCARPEFPTVVPEEILMEARDRYRRNKVSKRSGGRRG